MNHEQTNEEIEQLRRRIRELETADDARRRAEAALRTSQTQYCRLLDNLSDFVLVVDPEARILFSNNPRLGPRQEELRQSVGFTHIAPEDRQQCADALRRAFETGEIQRVLTRTVYGEWCDCRLVPVVEPGAPSATLIICDDVTEQRRAEQSLREEQRLLGDMLDLQERERRLFACEIHDGLAQQLTGAQMRLEAIRSFIQAAPAEAQQAYQEALALLEDGIREARRLISGLRPPILDESGGIAAALAYLVEEAQAREEPDIEFSHEIHEAPWDPLVETAVFRIVQESLHNACRHSRSPQVRVALRSDAQRVWVEVEDWGVGFVPEQVAPDRFGLQGIRERAKLLKGNVSIDTSPGKGSRVRVELPLRRGDAVETN
ncbi:MAG: PAS domain-containing protein [Pirellulales bacterium]|nr:PAS domain-containing protein [Pirellulales bacterium]